MNGEGYAQILKEGLLPFIKNTYPEGHRFMQDSDPKHTSKVVQKMLQEEGVNWWKTPAESPDCNPIENLWEYKVKPSCKKELVDRIYKFWESITVAKCQKYIRHLRKVLPKLIEVGGGPYRVIEVFNGVAVW